MARTDRYYIHGDQQEGSSDKYFCNFCDAFEPYDHFMKEHRVSENDARYALQIKIHKDKDHREYRARRPANSYNIFG